MDETIARIAAHAADPRFSDLPAAVAHEGKRRIIDTLGCAIAAFDVEPARIARALALRVEHPQGASVLGTGRLALPELAAFANGVMGRVMDGNDCFPCGGGHPSDVIAPILAVAESVGADGRAALGAIALGYDIHHALFHNARVFAKGFDHVLYTAIASAAGAARLVGLDRRGIANAIALAVTPNLPLAVTRRGHLSMWKGCASGNAARNGVFAALAARAGMTGPETAVEGTHGLREIVGGFTLAPFPAAPGPFRILQADMKFFLVEYHAQGPILAALKLRPAFAVDDIAAIRIHTYTFAYREIGSGAEKWRPTTRETADHSLPYVVAAALIDGRFDDAIFDPSRFTDARILALADRISVIEDAELQQRFGSSFPCRVDIITRDGVAHHAAIENPRGHHDDPMSDEEVAAKFRTLALRKLPPERVDRVLDRLWRFEAVERISDVFDDLRVDME